MQTPVAQRRNQPSIVAIAGDLPRTTRQHDTGMKDIRPGELHARA